MSDTKHHRRQAGLRRQVGAKKKEQVHQNRKERRIAKHALRIGKYAERRHKSVMWEIT
jgi:hypothetical protein